MSCISPLQVWYADGFHKSGKRKFTFKIEEAISSSYMLLPCGRCVTCRLERSRQWAIRCIHEAQMHPRNCFITLTYSDEFLPDGGTLVLRDWQLFMKKFRNRYGNGIKFFHCGEYGEKLLRPHYHACIFGFDFDDREFFKMSNGIPLFRSAALTELWGKGHCSVGDVTFESAAYVARYIMKKVNGVNQFYHYALYTDLDTGEVVMRKPEYTTMSRNPGIGKRWFDKYMRDVYPHGFMYLRERKVQPPKYYDSLYELIDPVDYARMKEERVVVVRDPMESSVERLRVKEICKESSLSRLPRVLEI